MWVFAHLPRTSIGPLMHVSALVHIVADVIAFATFPAFTVWVLFFLPPRSRGDDDDDLRPSQIWPPALA
jgi:hypothetical protein